MQSGLSPVVLIRWSKQMDIWVSTADDYLGVKVSYVDREKIGAIGIRGSGGFALSAAQVDTRIKAVATTSMYDITDVRGMFGDDKD